MARGKLVIGLALFWTLGAAAVEAFQQAERLQPDNAIASYYLGQSLVLVGRPDEAVAAMERAIERKPAQSDLLEIFPTDSRELPFPCTLETQNYRPLDERELTFSAYGYQGTDVCGFDLVTKKVTNYSDSSGQYDEPEGIFPDGQSTLVECDKQNLRGSGHIDLWKLKLDGSEYERLNSATPAQGSNPVVSDDGRFIAFQLAKSREAAGVGHGIFVFDIDKVRTAKP